jgi:hypothetical protein
MAGHWNASGGTGSAPLSLHGGEDYQEKLEHRFLDAARRLPFNIKFNLTLPPVTQAKKFQMGADDGNVGDAPQPH